MMRPVDAEALLAALDPDVAAVARALRARLLHDLVGTTEQPDAAANVIGYGHGPGYKGLVCTIILSKKGVKLGFYRGAELPDPDRLLEGAGKVHRYVPVASAEAAADPKLGRLIEAARAAATERVS
jgi:hypothetical protein